MTDEAPDFRLRHVDDHECDGHVEIVPITEVDEDTSLGRREVFRAGLTAAALFGLLAACGTESSTPPPTSAPATPPPTTPPPTTTTPPPTTPRAPAAAPVPVPTTRRPPPTTTRRPPRTTRKPTQQPKKPRGGGTLTKPCDRKPVPKGYVCTCNCVRVPG